MNVFIWTEIYNCGKIGKIALESFRKHHPDVMVNVYGIEADFSIVAHIPLLEFHVIPQNVQHAFKQGHLGTASLWAQLILSRPERYMVHFDSDVIFRAPCMPEMEMYLDMFSIVGPIRNYVNNPNGRDDVRHLQDLAQTYFFGFDKSLISGWHYDVLTRMCQGTYNPIGHPVIDFFDPVMFEILGHGGTIHHLGQESYGSCDNFGKRAVGLFAEQNRHMDFGHNICHFSAVGSGMNFYHNGSVNVPKSYVEYAIERYALYCNIFYNETLNVPIDTEKYKAILEVKDWMG